MADTPRGSGAGKRGENEKKLLAIIFFFRKYKN
jgi:hypothetical protein